MVGWHHQLNGHGFEQALEDGSFKCLPSGSVVKNPPAMLETQQMRVRSLDWDDPLEEGMATHSSIHARKIPWTEEPVGL